MRTVAVLAQKGGVGKSMMARSMAVCALGDGLRTVLIDADPQATVVAWGKRREHAVPAILQVAEQSIGRAVAEAKGRGADLVVVDTPPSVQAVISNAAGVADSCIIVTGIFPEDIETVGAVVQLVRAVRKPAVIVINKTTRSQALTLARTALATFRLPLCPITLSQLVSHPYAAAEGLTASEREPGSKAATELAQVWAWLKKEGIA